MDDVPDNLGGTLFIVGNPVAKWVVLQCPCGCEDRIDVNLMRSRRPFWKLSLHRDRASLYPSVWVPKDKCGSHFWLNKNRIEWV